MRRCFQLRLGNKFGINEPMAFVCSKCVRAAVTEKGIASEPALEVNSQGNSQIEDEPNKIGGSCHTTMVNANRVADDPITDQEESNNVTEATAWLDITDRMKVIDYCRKKKRLSPEAVNVLRQRSRLSSQRAYNEYWKNWVKWRYTQDIDLLTANTQDSVRYLTSLQRFSRSHLNGIHSGLASVYNLIHPDKGGLANDPFIQDFFKSLESMILGMPRKHCKA